MKKRRDVFSKRKRSEIMASIKGHGNKTTELAFITVARRNKLRGWARNVKGLPGRPDFVFKAAKVAVFIDGCFWHGCPRCSKRRIIHTNKKYWSLKIFGNKERDRRNSRLLRKLGWKVRRILEHQLKRSPDRVIEKLKVAIRTRE